MSNIKRMKELAGIISEAAGNNYYKSTKADFLRDIDSAEKELGDILISQDDGSGNLKKQIESLDRAFSDIGKAIKKLP